MALQSDSHELNKISTNLCQALLTGIGAEALVRVFPDDNSFCFFTETLQQMEKMIARRVPTKIIEKLNKKINAMVSYVKYPYLVSKRAGANKEELTDILYNRVFNIYAPQVIMKARESFYGVVYVNVFIIAANIHLILLQELIRADPLVDDPSESDMIDFFRHEGLYYMRYLTRVKDEVTRIRMKALKEAATVSLQGQPTPNKKVLHFKAVWKDRLTKQTLEYKTEKVNGKYSKGNLDEVDYRLRTARSEYLLDACRELDRQMNYPSQVLHIWNRVILNPLISEVAPPFVVDSDSDSEASADEGSYTADTDGESDTESDDEQKTD